MLLVGALELLYAFFYCSGSLAELGQAFETQGSTHVSFTAAEGKNNATLFNEIQGFNDVLMYCGISMILLAVLLYVTSCNKRRNYYVSNFVATGLCAGGNIIMSIILMAGNVMWRNEFLNVDFDAWYKFYEPLIEMGAEKNIHYSESTLWFDIGFAVYPIIIIASVLLILNLVWKIKLMKGEKELLSKSKELLAGGETV